LIVSFHFLRHNEFGSLTNRMKEETDGSSYRRIAAVSVKRRTPFFNRAGSSCNCGIGGPRVTLHPSSSGATPLATDGEREAVTAVTLCRRIFEDLKAVVLRRDSLFTQGKGEAIGLAVLNRRRKPAGRARTSLRQLRLVAHTTDVLQLSKQYAVILPAI
jgi:hypothetical protein